MKNELGIEVCCENCHNLFDCYVYNLCENNERFHPSCEALEKRIKELQEQQFTKEELQFIKNRLDECIEEWDVPDMVFMAHQILKKIEQTLKKSETNLNKQQYSDVEELEEDC